MIIIIIKMRNNISQINSFKWLAAETKGFIPDIPDIPGAWRKNNQIELIPCNVANNNKRVEKRELLAGVNNTSLFPFALLVFILFIYFEY